MSDMKDITVAITAASYHGNKGAAAMLQSIIKQLFQKYGPALNVNLMSTYPRSDRELLPFDFIRVISAKPVQVLFIAFPMAVLYWLFRWFPPARWFLKKSKILKSYLETDIVIDAAGISFVDTRGFVMNTYAAVTMAIPLMMGVPVVKYTQALGSFKSPYNRILAKIILPKLLLICARGKVTEDYLAGIGITKNVKLCADGAFSMPDDEVAERETNALCATDDFYKKPFVALSLSSVVDGRCAKRGMDYRKLMLDFIEYLNGEGYGVLFIANAIRLNTEKPRNNDVPLCNDLFEQVKNKSMVRWYPEEMSPEKIRELISRSEMLVGSRFHAMIGALEREVPVLLVGWSHKYGEVLDMFSLGDLSVDYSNLTLSLLVEKFSNVLARKDEIKQSLAKHLPDVKESSRSSIEDISKIIDNLPNKRKIKLLDFNNPNRYIGDYHSSRIGYAVDENIRENSASGGMVTALLCGLLREKEISGAWVTRSFVQDGELTYETKIATTEDEIKACSSSIYMYMPLMKHVDMLENFPGKVAVVLLPCQTHALDVLLKNKPELREKVVLKIALYCSGSHDKQCTVLSLKKKGIQMSDVSRVIYRRGHYRGRTIIINKDGIEQEISYAKTICAYKNAYYFSRRSCMVCQDHFGKSADLSFGDIWLKSMKDNPIKHTSCIIHNENGLSAYNKIVQNGDILDFHFDRRKLLLSQKRALVFKYNCAKFKGMQQLDTSLPSRWNHRLAYALARRNQALSEKYPHRVEKIPLWFVFYYMAFIRVLLSF